jgi:cytochrome c peroxidase
MSRSRRSRLLAALVAAAVAGTTSAACPEHLQFLGPQCTQWQSRVLPPSLPPARGNAFADNDAAAALGMKIFFDNRFSRAGSGVACVSCHEPEHAFAERKPTSHAIGDVDRNAPDLINAAWYTRFHFWDGKVDNLWSAPLFTLEQDVEMGGTRLGVVHALASIYKVRYEKVFGPLPDFSDPRRFPPEGRPGMVQYDAMSRKDKDEVDRVYANLGKALEAYMRKLAGGRSPFDDFIGGNGAQLPADALRGMVAFTRRGCDTCHTGPAFTDEQFHNIGYPAREGKPRDRGREAVPVSMSKWEFTTAGRFADPRGMNPKTSVAEAAPAGAGFRTPSLRNVMLTAPYGHDGSFDTLDGIITAHTKVLPDMQAPDEAETHDIIEFLRTLSGRQPPPPWNYWPGG